MAKREMEYRMKSLSNLLECYAYECGRDNIQDREVTQKAIVNEVYARIKDAFDMIDSDPKSVDRIYKQLIEH